MRAMQRRITGHTQLIAVVFPASEPNMTQVLVNAVIVHVKFHLKWTVSQVCVDQLTNGRQTGIASFSQLVVGSQCYSIRRTSEAGVCGAERGLDVVAERDADEGWIIDPRTAAQHSKPSPVLV